MNEQLSPKAVNFRTQLRSDWITTTPGNLSFYRKGRISADLEQRPPHHWRLVYYHWTGDRLRLQFEFEDLRLPEATVRLIVEKHVEGM